MAEEEASGGAIGAADAAIIFGANTSSVDAAFAKINKNLDQLEARGKSATVRVMAVFEPANLEGFRAKAQAQLDAMPFAISVLPKLPSGWKDVIQAQLNTGAFYVNVQPRVTGGGSPAPVAPVPTAGGVWNPTWASDGRVGNAGPQMMARAGSSGSGGGAASSGFRLQRDRRTFPSPAAMNDPFQAARAAEEEALINRMAGNAAQQSANANIRRNSSEIIRLRGGKQFGDTVIPNISPMPLSYRTGMIAGSGADAGVIAAQRQAVGAINAQQLSQMQWGGLGRARQQQLLRSGISARTDINWGANPQAAAALASAEADVAARAAAQAEAVRRTQLRAMPGAYAQNSLFDIERARAANSAIPVTGMASMAPLTPMGRIGNAWANRGVVSPAAMKQQMQLQNDARREFFAGQTLMRSFLLPGVVAGGASLYMNAKLESEMGRIQGLTQTNRGEIIRERQQLLDQSLKGPTSALDLAGGLYEISSAGYKGRAGKTVLDATSMGSMAGLGTNQQLGGLTTSILSAYGRRPEDSQKVIDTLTQMVVFGKGEASQYSGALGKVVTTAAMAGVELPEVAANLATMSRVGISPDTGATALNQLLMHIQAPTPAAKKVMDSIGTSPDQLRESLRDNGLLKTLEDLKKMGGNRIDIFDTLFGNVRGLKSFLATAGTQMDTYKMALNQMNNAHGATKNALEAMGGTFEFQWGRMVNAAKKGIYDIAGNSMPSLTKTLEGMADTLPRRLERTGYAVQTALNSPVGPGIGPAAGVGLGALAIAGPAFHLSALVKDARASQSLGRIFGVRNAPILALSALAAARVADTQFGAFGGKTDGIFNAIENPDQAGVAGTALNAALLGATGYQVLKGASGIGGRLGGTALATRFPAMFRTAMPTGMYGPATPLSMGGGMTYGTASAPIMAGLGLAGAVATGLAINPLRAYHAELGREIDDREVHTGNVRASQEATMNLFDRAGKGATGNNLLTEGLDEVREKFLLAKDDAAQYGSVVRDLDKLKLKVINGTIKMDPGARYRFIEEADQIKKQIEATKVQIAIEIDSASKGTLDDILKGLRGVPKWLIDNLNGNDDESARWAKTDYDNSPEGKRAAAIAAQSGSNVFTAPGALTPQQQSAKAAQDAARKSPSAVFGTITGLKVAPGEDLNARVAGWDSKNDGAWNAVNSAWARINKDPKRMREMLGPELANTIQGKYQQLKEDRARDAANRPGSSDNADTLTAQKNLNEANALRADISRMQGQGDALGKEKAGYDAYAGSLDGILGRLREFGERTEASRIRSQMFKKDQDGVADSFKSGAIAIGDYLDQMTRMQQGQSTLKTIFGDMQAALVEKGLDPSVLDPDIARMQNVLPFTKTMQDLQGKGLAMGQDLATQAASKSDALQQAMNDLTANIKALNDTISGLESNGGLGTTPTAGTITDGTGVVGVAQSMLGAGMADARIQKAGGDTFKVTGKKNGAEWCVGFIQAVSEGTQGHKIANGTLSVAGLRSWGKDNGQFTGKPHVGDIFTQMKGTRGKKGFVSHTGIITKVNEDGTFETIAGNEGNQNNSLSRVKQGNKYRWNDPSLQFIPSSVFGTTGGAAVTVAAEGGGMPKSTALGKNGPLKITLIPAKTAKKSSANDGVHSRLLPDMTKGGGKKLELEVPDLPGLDLTGTPSVRTQVNFQMMPKSSAIPIFPTPSQVSISGKGKQFTAKTAPHTTRAIASGDYKADAGQWSGNAYDLSSYNRNWMEGWGPMLDKQRPFNQYEWQLQSQFQSAKTQEELARAAASALGGSPEAIQARSEEFMANGGKGLGQAMKIARHASRVVGGRLRDKSESDAVTAMEINRRKQKYMIENPFDPAAELRYGLNDLDNPAHYYSAKVRGQMVHDAYMMPRANQNREWNEDQFSRRSGLMGTMTNLAGVQSGMTATAAQQLADKAMRDLAIRRKYAPERNIPFTKAELERRGNAEIAEADAGVTAKNQTALALDRRGLQESSDWQRNLLTNRIGMQNNGYSTRRISDELAAMEAGRNAQEIERNNPSSTDLGGFSAYGRGHEASLAEAQLRNFSQSIDELNQRTRELASGFVQMADKTGLASRAVDLMDPEKKGLLNGSGDIKSMAEMAAYGRQTNFNYDMAGAGARSDSQRLGSELGVLRGSRAERLERMRAAAGKNNTPFDEGVANAALDADEEAKADEQKKASLLEQERAYQGIKRAREDARLDGQSELATLTAVTDKQKVLVEVQKRRNDYAKAGLEFTARDEQEATAAANEQLARQKEYEKYQVRVNLMNAGKAGTLAGFQSLMGPGDGGALARSKREEDFRWMSLSMDLQDRGYSSDSMEVKLAEKRHKQLKGDMGGQNIFEKFLSPVVSGIGGVAAEAGAGALNKGLWGLIGGNVASLLGMGGAPSVMGGVGPSANTSSKGVVGQILGSIGGFGGPIGAIANAASGGMGGDKTIQANNVTVIGGNVSQSGANMAAGLTTEQMFASAGLNILGSVIS